MATTALERALATLRAQIDTDYHLSDWQLVDQARIDGFAQATSDFQWIHTDPERAARESPYGATIAHGFLLMSLYATLRGHAGGERPPYPGVERIINYGTNRMRFPEAVRSGDRVRGRFTLIAADDKGGTLEIVERFTVEIEGRGKPGCVADVIRRMYFAG